MTNLDEVRALKSNMHQVFDSPQGQEIMKFLELSCGWYESVFSPEDRDMVLINAGRREVLATIKTILNFSPEQITEIVKARTQ
jgi:hypothetical protein